MKRRRVLGIGVVALGLPRAAFAQKPVPRVGFLVAGDPEPSWTLFRKAMTELGYVEDRNIAYDYRAADGNGGQLDAMAADLARLKVGAIVAVLSPAIFAAKKATTTIPIVFFGGPPDFGVTNVARPEGNLTGVYSASTTLAGKGLQLFREIKPATATFGILLNAADPFHVPLLRDVEAVAHAEKIELTPLSVKTRDELPKAFDEMAARKVDGVLVQPSLGLQVTAELALKRRLPAISFRREFADAGGLYSYGADPAANQRIVAADVDKILKGAAPRDLPVQQSSRIEFVVNHRTAKALGLALPPMFLAQADEVIE